MANPKVHMHIKIPELAKTDIKQTNLRLVLSEVILNGPASRTHIAEQTGLAISTISRATNQLLETGLLLEQTPTPSPNRSGRRMVELDINPNGGYVIGVSLNAFEQVVALANLKQRVASYHFLNLVPSKTPEEVLSKVVDSIRDLITENNVSHDSIIGVGVAAAGAVDSDQGIIRWAPTLDWEDVHAGDFLAKKLNLDVYIANIPNAMNLAETRFGLGRGFNNVVLLNGALGVGASLFLDNHLIHGNSFQAGVLGGLELLVDDQGERISVANAAGGWGIINAFNADEKRPVNPPPAQMLEDILQASNNGDSKAITAATKAGLYMGRVFELVEGVTHPDLLILSGTLGKCRAYVKATRHHLDTIWKNRIGQPDLVISQRDSGEAARLLALQEFLLCR